MKRDSSANLARAITRSGSLQTYFTAWMMVDRDLVDDFFRAYAYFRWIDDVIDVYSKSDSDRIAFISNQKDLIHDLYRKKQVESLIAEEEILRDLINHDRGEDSGLQSFIYNMFAIIEFDAKRKGRLISSDELNWYISTLGKSVTDGLLYFIGNSNSYPQSDSRYKAGIAAHISHLLRDMHQDNADGFINIPREYLESHGLDHNDMDNPAYKAWVRDRVNLAREFFLVGKQFLNGLDNLRCKIVGHWYCTRFEVVLDTIERDGYTLREQYHERRRISTWLQVLWLGVCLTFGHLLSLGKQKSLLTANKSNVNTTLPKQ